MGVMDSVAILAGFQKQQTVGVAGKFLLIINQT
jgi:hypothetical protein